MEFEPEKPKSKYNIFMPIILSLVLVVGISIGYILSNRILEGNLYSANPHNGKKGNDKINSLLEYIEYQYVDTINKKELVEKTVASMLESLDPHSAYIPASDFELVNEPLEGNFDGIGVEFNIFKDTIRVVTPIEGGPSEKMGIRAGDKFIKVNGKNVAGVKITNKQVFDNLRGKKGTKVIITVLRSGSSKPIDFEITRDAIPLYSLDVSYMVTNDIGYIKISKFSATTYDEYIKAFNDLSRKGMKKLILDLRGNPGGYLNAAVSLSDEFLSNGLQIVYTQGKASPKKVYKATSKGSFENNPLVILIDEGSASASEIVAGATQDNDRATIIGRRSFGKGLVQDQLQLSDGSAIRLTIARYYTPTGRCIQKPYSEGTDEYYNEEYNRYKHGELLNKDSIKVDSSKIYHTPEGKTVYGGGGIIPDIFVPLDTSKTNTYLNKIFFTGALNGFSFEYADANRSKLKAIGNANDYISKYEISDDVINKFYAYCLKEDSLEIPSNMKLKTGEALKPYLKALIGRSVFDKDAYYPILNKKDKCISKAIDVLSN